MKYKIINAHNNEEYFLLKNPKLRVKDTGGEWMIYPYLHHRASYQKKAYKPIYFFSLKDSKKHIFCIEKTQWYLEKPEQKQFYLKIKE